jgi:hypothetical protein
MLPACRYICSIWTRKPQTRLTCSSILLGSLRPRKPCSSFLGPRSRRQSLLSHRYLRPRYATLSLCKQLRWDPGQGSPQTRDAPLPLLYSPPCSSHAIIHCGVWNDLHSCQHLLGRALQTGMRVYGRCTSRRSALPPLTVQLWSGGDGISNFTALNPHCRRTPSQ